MRVLGVARAEHEGPGLPDSQRDLRCDYLGLVGLADPLRPTVADAVRDCRSAGIRVVMITGDDPATARAIARQAGLDSGDLLIGEDLERMSDKDLVRRIGGATPFARIVPEQAPHRRSALGAGGVAMTGHGVNGAPSLKSAHIGTAMGGRGTDVAREASELGTLCRCIVPRRRVAVARSMKMGNIVSLWPYDAEPCSSL